MIKNIYVDLDGTLLDVSDRLYFLYRDLLKEWDIDNILTQAKYWKLKRNGKSEKEIIKNVLNEKQANDYLKKRIVLLESWSYLESDRLFPWAKEILNSLGSKYRVVLVTKRGKKENLQKQLQGFGIVNSFDLVISEAETKDKLINEDESFTKQESIIVGDTEEDILSGKKLGIGIVAVLSGLRDRPYMESLKPDYIIEDLSKLQKEVLDVRK